MAKLRAVATIAALGMGLLACGDAAPRAHAGSVSSPVDGESFALTKDDFGRVTGATRTTLEGEVQRMRVWNGYAPTSHTLPTGVEVPRDWDMVRTDWEEGGRVVLTQYTVVEPLAHITFVRSFLWNDQHEELTCFSDFSQWRGAGYGLFGVDYRAETKSRDFRYDKWPVGAPETEHGLACKHPSFSPVFERLGKAWAPFLGAYDAKLDAQISALYASFDPTRPGDGVAPVGVGLMMRADLTEDEKYAIKRACLAGLVGAAAGVRGGPWAAGAGFALGFSGSIFASWLEMEHVKAQQEEKNRREVPRGPVSRGGDRDEGSGEPGGRGGGYVPPTPGDVGWDGQRGDGDGQGRHAGDVPGTGGGSYGGGGSYPGGSGPWPSDSGGAGGADGDSCGVGVVGGVSARAWCT